MKSKAYDVDCDLPLRLHLSIVSYVEEPSAESSNTLAMLICTISASVQAWHKKRRETKEVREGIIAIKTILTALEAHVKQWEYAGKGSIEKSLVDRLNQSISKIDTMLSGMPYFYWQIGNNIVMRGILK